MELSVRPDFLILPSKLRYFIKSIDDSIVINPGFLHRKGTSGTFALIKVIPIPEAALQTNEGDEDEMLYHGMTSRAGIEIIRI